MSDKEGNPMTRTLTPYADNPEEFAELHALPAYRAMNVVEQMAANIHLSKELFDHCAHDHDATTCPRHGQPGGTHDRPTR